MSSTSAKFGFRPVFHTGGQIRSEAYTIASGYASNIFKGDPVAAVAAGGIELAAAGATMLGIFAGCEYKDSNGKPVVSNYWPTGTTATDIVAWVWSDPNIVFETELTNAGAPTTIATGVNAGCDHTAGSGSTSTGLSGAYLASGDLTTTAGFKILRKAGDDADAWTDAYVKVQVIILEHFNRTAAAGV